jgi:hypothetical protein
MKFIKLISFLLFFISQLFFAQELPPIIKFNSNYYKAGSQNLELLPLSGRIN